jgi:hypothetical protein
MMSAKREFIEAYFNSWEDKLDRAKALLDLDDYIYEGILVLLCHIGAFSAMRYPTLKDGEAYKKILIQYSGMKDFFEQIDLKFFYQWPRSIFRNNGNYKELKAYNVIKDLFVKIYGAEDEVDSKNRFINQDELVACVEKENINGIDIENFKSKLYLFSLAEITYRYIRCGAVHNGTLSFVNTNSDEGFEDGYIITKEILYETAVNIKDHLADECIRLNKWPFEIESA